jgi:hypothetical protein
MLFSKLDASMWINYDPGPCSIDMNNSSSNGTVWNPHSWSQQTAPFPHGCGPVPNIRILHQTLKRTSSSLTNRAHFYSPSSLRISFTRSLFSFAASALASPMPTSARRSAQLRLRRRTCTRSSPSSSRPSSSSRAGRSISPASRMACVTPVSTAIQLTSAICFWHAGPVPPRVRERDPRPEPGRKGPKPHDDQPPKRINWERDYGHIHVCPMLQCSKLSEPTDRRAGCMKAATRLNAARPPSTCPSSTSAPACA